MADEGHPSGKERIGPYRIERPLGSGGMGEVVLAYDERLRRHVAIKRIRHDADTTAADRERFRREARAAAGLNHPAIVQVHDILSEDHGDAIVMELVEGASVAEKLKSGPLPLSETLQIGRRVAEGLAEAHRVRVVHRDLKAENVMLTPAGRDSAVRVKILDFGLAKRLLGSVEETLTKKGAILGTVRAMSPEQASGGEVDSRSDLFSLGVLLYEMVTGRSPFRGTNSLETLHRVITEAPQPVRELRPDVPFELAKLIEWLLEKSPEHRPNSALQVAQVLDDIAGSQEDSPWPDTVAPPGEADTLSDAPTGSLTAAEASALTAPVRAGRRGLLAVLGLILVAVAAVVAWRVVARRVEPLRVVVLRPEVASPSDELELVASGVQIAALGTLADLEGLAPVEPSEIGNTSGSAVEVARAVAADEVLTGSVERRLGNARILLRRIRGLDGVILWAKSFDVPLRPEGALVVAEAVAVKLQRAYPARSLRKGTPRLEADDADYAAFVQVLHRIESGEVSWEPELERLEAISQRSPRFLAPCLLGASAAWTLHSDTRDPTYLERSEKLLARARKLVPEDPRPIFWAFRTALASGETKAARDTLAELAKVAPNAILVPLGRSQLMELDGDLEGAAAEMRSVVERVPSWQNLHWLADLEYRRGQVADARKHLEDLIGRAPNNTWGLAKLAELELLYGNLERVEELELKLIELKPSRSYFSNLGLARFLLGRYDEARESYLRALAIHPGHLTVSLNLADTELALGHFEEARAQYRRILGELDQRDGGADESMIMAQCLAHLDEDQRAVAVTLGTLQRHPEDAEVTYQAALVYALVGETASALVNVEKALGRGIQPRWFTIPGFGDLESDPRFRTLLAGAGNPPP